MKIAVIGTGYVGLVTGACFAEVGHNVTCIDINTQKINSLKNGNLPFYEPGLDHVVHRNVYDGRLKFCDSYDEISQECKIFFVAVPTPSTETGDCDLGYVKSAVRAICQMAKGSITIIIKSTVPAGTISYLEIWVSDFEHENLRITFVSNPEFLKEGSAVSDCMKPDRIVIGCKSQEALSLMRALYAPFTLNHDRIIEMDPTSSEMTKYASNAMLATRISFMNELARTCEKVGANIKAVRIGMGSDARIGYHFLYAGIGWGGSCFPKDIRALIQLAKQNKCPASILEAVYEVNEKQKNRLVEIIEEYFEGEIKGKTLTLWGLAFKPDTDDIREAPSLNIIESLLSKGAIVRVYDPVCMKAVKDLYPEIIITQDPYHAALGADAVALLTEWKQFRSVDFGKLKDLVRGKVFFDGRNQYQADVLAQEGWDYRGIGQGPRGAVCAESLG